METPYRSLEYYDSVVKEFLENNKEVIGQIKKYKVTTHRSTVFDYQGECFGLARRFVECLQNAGAMQFYLGINDLIFNKRHGKACRVWSIEVGENRFQDGELVVAFKVHYQGDSDRPDHKIIERLLIKDQKTEEENRMYQVNNQYIGYLYDVPNENFRENILELGEALADFDGTNMPKITTLLRTNFNLYFVGYKVGDIIDKRRVKKVVNDDVYRKLDDELEIMKIIINDGGSAATYIAASAHSTKYRYRVVFTRQNMEELPDGE